MHPPWLVRFEHEVFVPVRCINNRDCDLDIHSDMIDRVNITFPICFSTIVSKNILLQQSVKWAVGKNVNSENAAIVYYDSYDDNGIIKSDPWYVIGYGKEGVASTEGSITLLAKSNMGLASCLNF